MIKLVANDPRTSICKKKYYNSKSSILKYPVREEESWTVSRSDLSIFFQVWQIFVPVSIISESQSISSEISLKSKSKSLGNKVHDLFVFANFWKFKNKAIKKLEINN